MKHTTKELKSAQKAFKSVLANPSYDDQQEQIAEIEKLKMSLARHNIRCPLETLKDGMFLPDREKPAEDPPEEGKKPRRNYLKGDEFLMVNPYKKPKKSKAAKKGGSKRRGSPAKKTKSPAKKRKNSTGSDDIV